MKKTVIIIIIIIAIIALIGVGSVIYYNTSLNAVSKNSEEVVVTIDKGSTSNEIAKVLKNDGAIQSDLTFKIYVKLNNISGMKAGTYKLNKNMSVSEIIDALKKGSDYNPDEIKITFLEGKNMRWIAKTIASNTNNSEADVYAKLSDTTYLNTLINKYWFITSDIENTSIYYSLEGYLFPDTYTFDNKDVSIETIFNAMLDQMQTKLSPYKTELQSQGAYAHKLLTVASIVELEASNAEDRAGVASVIYNRIKANMSIGSDVTTYYAIKVDMSERDLKQSEINTYNPYNTRGPNMEGKLPIGPIASIGDESLDAAMNPDDTNYLYFVADKNGKVYFAETIEQHNNNIQYLKNNNLWMTY